MMALQNIKVTRDTIHIQNIPKEGQPTVEPLQLLHPASIDIPQVLCYRTIL
jgi:hypothetical protein